MTRNNVRRTGILRIESGLLERVPRLIKGLLPSARIRIITDTNVRLLYGTALHRSLVHAGFDTMLLDIPPGESSKSQQFLSSLHTQLLTSGTQRGDLIIALGGGVIGDLAGFVAATIYRGIPYLQVPTTLLAQVDSSIGGKVGINHRMGKNLIGAFYSPIGIFIDPSVLRTLSRDEFRNGLAEVVKIAFACDASFFNWLERNRRAIASGDASIVEKLVKRSARLKALIAGRDKKDQGVRRILNLGHTVGHAVEAASDYKMPHGKAISIGMAVESNLAVEMELLHSRDQLRLVRLLRDFKLPVAFPRGLYNGRFRRALELDKKRMGGGQRLSLPRRIGDTVANVPVTLEDLQHSLVPGK